MKIAVLTFRGDSPRPSLASRIWGSRLILILALLLSGLGARAQVGTTYTFAASTGASLDPMTGATQLIGPSIDNTPNDKTNVGFQFTMEGVTYSTFSVTPDGFLTFGPAAASQPTNDLASSTNIPKLAPHWDDLATGTDGAVSYVLTGTAPNRRLAVEWFVNAPANPAGPSNSRFQVWLDEGTNVISFVYGTVVGGGSYSVGIRGSGAGNDFISIDNASDVKTTGTANDAQTAATTAGKRYTFTPLSNDLCSGAFLLTCGQTVTGTTRGATSAGDPTGSCGTAAPSNQPGVFYTFVGTGYVATVSTCAGPTASTGDTELFVYSGSCGNLTCVDGNDDIGTICSNNMRASSVTFTSIPGLQYYFFVQGYNSTVDFGLSVNCVPPDLVVSSAQNVSGTYTNVTVQSGGRATVTGPLSVDSKLTVQSGGVLIQNCQPVTGLGVLNLLAGGELQICDPAGIALSGATGAIQLSGIRTYGTGALYTYNATAAQVTGSGLPGTVRTLTVNNPNALTLSQGVSISQLARLQSGNLITNGQPLTLLSAATGTALVDNTGGLIVGTGVMQRAVTSSVTGPAYRQVSSPVVSTTFDDLTTGGFTPTFNPAFNSNPTPGTTSPFPTVFAYDQSRLATVTSSYDPFDIGWVTPAGGSSVMQPNVGYTVNAPATAAPIDFMGTFNNAAQNSATLSRGLAADAGWQLLGNPYPSPLDWNTVTPAQIVGMDAAMYVFQSSGQYAGTYRSYANGLGASPLIDAGSGYFARVTTPGGTGTVSLTNANRVTTFDTQPVFGRGTAETRPLLQLQLTGAGLGDETFVYLQSGATAGVDARYDATKLPNPNGMNLASLSGSTTLAINGLPPIGTTDVTVPLSVFTPQTGAFELAVTNLLNFGTTTVYLRDAQAGTQQLLAPGGRYAFTLPTATAGTGRFALVLRPATVTATQPVLTAATVSLYPNPAHRSFTLLLPPLVGQRDVRATLFNTLGQVVLTRTISLTAAGASTEFRTQGLATGVYTLRLQADKQLFTQRVVIE